MSTAAVADTPTPAAVEADLVFNPASAQFPAVDHEFVDQGPFSALGEYLSELADAEPKSDAELEAPAQETDSAEPEAQTEPAAAEEVAEGSEQTLVAEATERYGMDKAVAESLGDNLPNVLAAMDRQAVALMRQSLGQEQAEQPPTPAPQPQPQKPEPAAPAIEKLKFDLDPEEYDEKQIAAFNAIADRVNQQMEMLQAVAQVAVASHSNLTQITGQNKAEAIAQRDQQLDSFFASLGDEFRDTFGKVPVAQLAETSPLLQARNKLVEEMGLLQAADAQAGRPRGTTEQYAQRALRLLHSDKIATSVRNQVQQEATKRRQQTIARPTGRNGSPLTGKQKALKHISEWLSSSGVGHEWE